MHNLNSVLMEISSNVIALQKDRLATKRDIDFASLKEAMAELHYSWQQLHVTWTKLLKAVKNRTNYEDAVSPSKTLAAHATILAAAAIKLSTDIKNMPDREIDTVEEEEHDELDFLFK